jgi:peptidoglycan/LPS O-acetylase OafA/YrhL
MTLNLVIEKPNLEERPTDVGSKRCATRVSGEEYFPEIDGLRAVAIVSVVSFHVGLPMFSGGFVGVDVFFVISGFLITRLLYGELRDTGTIDILDFFARRVRRLLPALGVVLATTLLASMVFLTPVGEQQELSSSAFATASFVSNFYFWRTQMGYFAGPSDQIPLLHMWTLAVEEQFYIIWPVTMALIAIIAKTWRISLAKSLMVTLSAGCVVSLLACSLTTPIRPDIAFYLTPFRAWEFGAGSLLAFVMARRTKSAQLPVLGSMLSFVGCGAIAASLVWFHTTTQFPGFSALLPVIGAGGVIMGALSAPGSQILRFLRWSPMVAVGKWSYSWYLWHWPLLAISRVISAGDHFMPRDLSVTVFALCLSAVTYEWLEQPIRRGKLWPFVDSRSTVLAGIIILVSAGCLAATTRLSADARVTGKTLLAAAWTAKSEGISYPDECSRLKSRFAGLAPIDRCTMGNSTDQRFLVLWGDSHAYHFIPALADYAGRKRLALLPRVMGTCLPAVPGIDVDDVQLRYLLGENCVDFNTAMVEALPQLKARGATVVVLAARWSSYPRLPDSYGSLAHIVEIIRHNALDVVMFAEVPGYSFSVPQCIARRGIEACSRTRADVDKERAPALQMLKRIVMDTPGVLLWDPIGEMCEERRCLTVSEGIVLYSDNNHLSVKASQRMSAPIGTVLDPVVEKRASR